MKERLRTEYLMAKGVPKIKMVVSTQESGKKEKKKVMECILSK